MKAGYWIVDPIDGDSDKREVVYLDEEGEVWLTGCDFSMGKDQFKFIRLVDLTD